jgi:hypothetical protein
MGSLELSLSQSFRVDLLIDGSIDITATIIATRRHKMPTIVSEYCQDLQVTQWKLLDCWTAPCMSGRFYTEPQEQRLFVWKEVTGIRENKANRV